MPIGLSNGELRIIADKLQVQFERLELLEQALIHRSYANEASLEEGMGHNERLEFLGDSVLSLVVSEMLMAANPDAQEGQLSQMRAALVNGDALAVHASRMGLGQAMLLGKGEDRSGGRQKPSLLADVFEAVLGAVYLNSGLDVTKALVERTLGQDIAQVATRKPCLDPKSRLQESLQATGGTPPDYELLDACGPDHDRQFEIAVKQDNKEIGRGAGRSKKLAEQAAAHDALIRMQQEEPSDDEGRTGS